MMAYEQKENQTSNNLADAVKKNPHLAKYLASLRSKGIAQPAYHVQLSRDMRYMKNVNVLYPVGDPIFIHIYERNKGERLYYQVVEPTVPKEFSGLLKEVDKALAALIGDEEVGDNESEKERILLSKLNSLVIIDQNLPTWSYKLLRKSGITVKIRINEETFSALRYQLILHKVKLGLIEPFIRDPYLEDISCDGVGPIFVEHKIFGSCETSVVFESEDQLDEFVISLSERAMRPVTYRRPIVDGALPDGSRINIVFGSDISMRGSNFTIRKFADVPISITQLIKWRTIDAMASAYLWLMLESGLSVWFCGETASGKTTLLRATCVFIRPEAKIISIEDTPEIIVPHDNWVREVTKQGEDVESSIELFDLLKASLRQRPNYIIVGEIRGKEAYVAFQAMQVGAPVITTFHAGSVQKLIQRLTGTPIEIPKSYIDILNCAVIQSAVRLPSTGTLERRVLGINEIVGYDSVEDRFDFIELFSWDPISDTFIFRGEGSSHLLENRIAVMRGIPRRRIREVYRELENRAAFLEKLIEKGVLDYFDVWRAIKVAWKVGVEEALNMILRGDKIWKS
ncbi:MAG: type II/IV secretion system ATPase subunit [Nitrososphaerota archaeon]|nr:type II/IV secretion system ATPase subunit [Aigarchaeota archaeon]MDW8076863.1 type II/IV secretion system ATPase subunit [Nitrososphaerota archaeon]